MKFRIFASLFVLLILVGLYILFSGSPEAQPEDPLTHLPQ